MRTLFYFIVGCALAGGASLKAAPPNADAAFEGLARVFIEDYLRMNPEEATQLGDHRYDDRLSDYSPASISAQVELMRRYRSELDKVEGRALTGANRIDARILSLQIDAILFQLTE